LKYFLLFKNKFFQILNYLFNKDGILGIGDWGLGVWGVGGGGGGGGGGGRAAPPAPPRPPTPHPQEE